MFKVRPAKGRIARVASVRRILGARCAAHASTIGKAVPARIGSELVSHGRA